MRQQHGVIARAQLLALGLSAGAIEHRLRRGRLYVLYHGVYAVGRREVERAGQWLAAVLACGPGALLSHASAAALWRIAPDGARSIHVSVAAETRRRPSGITVHRRAAVHGTTCRRIPVTSPLDTLIDLAASSGQRQIERAVNEADALGLIDPEQLRDALETTPPRPGVGVLRRILDRRTFRFTRSNVERRFLGLVRDARLPLPETNVHVNGFEVDFHWPELGLVVEADSLTYHRTPAQQATDRLRDQAHSAAGLTTLRYTEAQIKYEPGHVQRTLAATAARLAA